ncbi:hypothetical protein K8353_05325 [Burkholderia contaminans]|nr:hypothetical protein [Burkholderia contaminans]
MLKTFCSSSAAMSAHHVDLSHTLPYEATFFDDRLAIERNDLDIAALLGVDCPVSDKLLVSLCGAPAGSDVQTYLDSTGKLTFAVTHPTLIRSENRITVFQTADRRVLELSAIDLADSATAGFGAAMLWRIVRACDTLGIARISALAMGGRKSPPEPGGPRLLGYYAWPRFGFDAPIPGVHADEADLFQYFQGYPVGLADGSLRSLRMLYATRIGRDFWRAAGSHRWVTFDVAPHGTSVLALRDYLIEKGIYDDRKAQPDRPIPDCAAVSGTPSHDERESCRPARGNEATP